jgi:hypothetical protein
VSRLMQGWSRFALQEFYTYSNALLEKDENLLRTAPGHRKA